MRITITSRPVVSLSGLNPSYCLKDSLFTLIGSPGGGIFWGNGVVGNDFNPKMAGSGAHKVYYQFGTPTCNRIDSGIATVIDTLIVDAFATDDTICIGENIELRAFAKGGESANYSYNWSNGNIGKNVFESPKSSGYYYVTVTDNCSDRYTDSVHVTVHPKVVADIVTSPIKCYGLNGFAEIIPKTDDNYRITWKTAPPYIGNRLNAAVTNKYFANVMNINTGCSLDTFATIPGYPKIKAYFITIPREGICLDPFNPRLDIINQSVGADNGLWDFGDGTKEAYATLSNPSHIYAADTNKYRVKLVVFNSGGCSDSMEVNVCLNDSVYAFIPNAFTPDGNNRNEIFKPIVAGANEYELIIYNRWGEKVFQTHNPNLGWDGNYNGNPCQNGVYLYLLTFKGKKSITKQEKGTLLLLR